MSNNIKFRKISEAVLLLFSYEGSKEEQFLEKATLGLSIDVSRHNYHYFSHFSRTLSPE